MDVSIKAQVEQYFNYIFFWWLTVVLSMYIFSTPDINVGAIKYLFGALSIYSGIKFLIYLFKVSVLINKHEKSTFNNELVSKLSSREAIIHRSIFSYLKQFPVEHPFMLISIIGLTMAELYLGVSENIQQVVGNIPILNEIFPSLPMAVLLMLFGDYILNFNVKFFSKAIKILFFLYSPFVIVFFFLGLLSPFILILKGIIELSSVQDLIMFLSNGKNLFWLIVYPWTIFYLHKCNVLKSQ